MSRTRSRTFARLPGLRRLVAVLAAGGGLALGLGCAHGDHPAVDYDGLFPASLHAAAGVNAPRVPSVTAPERSESGGLRTVGYQEVVAPTTAPNVVGSARPAVVEAAPRIVSIDLDTVLSTTVAQNLQIVLARKKADEALAAADCCGCGLAKLLRHDSGASDTDGDEGPGRKGGGHGAACRIKAKAQYWQRRAELARTTNETLLDAGNTYFDLLTARRGEAVARELEKYQLDLLSRAEKLAKDERSAVSLVESIRAELAGRTQVLAKLRQQGDAAAAKLVYLLELPAGSQVVPVDATLNTVELVDATQPVQALVARAQAEGPGVRELEALIGVIQEGIDQAGGLKGRLPSVQCQVKLASARLEETRLALQDTRAKLALGVQEARSAILSGRDQIRSGSEQIRHAAETYRLSDKRLKENAPGGSTTEVLQAIRGLELAHFNYLTAVAAYDKAEVRLLLLLGQGPDCKLAVQAVPLPVVTGAH